MLLFCSTDGFVCTVFQFLSTLKINAVSFHSCKTLTGITLDWKPKWNQQPSRSETTNNAAISEQGKESHTTGCTLRKPLYHSWISSSLNCVLARRSSSCSGFNLLFCFPISTSDDHCTVKQPPRRCCCCWQRWWCTGHTQTHLTTNSGYWSTHHWADKEIQAFDKSISPYLYSVTMFKLSTHLSTLDPVP